MTLLLGEQLELYSGGFFDHFARFCFLAEQHQIICILEKQFAAIDQNERAIDIALQRAEALRQSILMKAFSGNSSRRTAMTNPQASSSNVSAQNVKPKLHLSEGTADDRYSVEPISFHTTVRVFRIV